ncbi:MAG: fumarate reductase/succinate dehydrogenase flavoprotein subunit, partial [Candidatus Omnitrophota bacterium]|nr:fumarate reductase/succinate dehydrogenase flavoprotein subunit [Candidatus Omnitrophota bacterium]
NLMSNLPGLFVIGEANFSDHGANRLGASALMQGLADGYFILPYTIGDYLVGVKAGKATTDIPEFKEAEKYAKEKINRLLTIRGKRTVDEFHRELGLLMWNQCGMARDEKGLKEALSRIFEIRNEFWQNVDVPGSGTDLNQSLERAGRVADFLEFAETMVYDALHRKESCGGHFREEFQTSEGEALRNDNHFCYVAAWEFNGVGKEPVLHKEPLDFEEVHLAQRNYK